LKEAAAVAKAYGLELSVENEPGAWCDTGVNTAAIVEAIGLEHVGVNWDPANAVYAGEAAYPVGYDAVRHLIQNVHIKDGIPLPPDKWENRLIGDGGVNWIGQLRAFQRDQPVPFYTLETHVFPLMESTREDLRRLRILEATVREFENP
jgi:sugar phosphate isomerase/epimerase